MSEPWFDPRYSGIFGTVLGSLGGAFGGMVGLLGRRGAAKAWVMGTHWALLGLSAAMLSAGILALIQGQPYGVWYGLGLTGVIGTAVLGSLLPVVRKVYREAEMRKLQAKDLR